jgi:hypothetical protein
MDLVEAMKRAGMSESDADEIRAIRDRLAKELPADEVDAAAVDEFVQQLLAEGKDLHDQIKAASVGITKTR